MNNFKQKNVYIVLTFVNGNYNTLDVFDNYELAIEYYDDIVIDCRHDPEVLTSSVEDSPFDLRTIVTALSSMFTYNDGSVKTVYFMTKQLYHEIDMVPCNN